MEETSDESSSSGDDSNDPSSDIESDAVNHSDIDINTQGRKGVGYGSVLVIDALFKPTCTVLNDTSPSFNLVWTLVAKLLIGGIPSQELSVGNDLQELFLERLPRILLGTIQIRMQERHH